MMHRSLALALVPLSLLALAARSVLADVPAASQATRASADLGALVREEIAAAASRPVEELWQRARELRDAERLGSAGELDRILDEQLRREDLPSQAAILLVASRLLGTDPDVALLSSALEPLVHERDEALARAAASLFSDRSFKELNRGNRGQLVKTLQEAAQDTSFSPAYRLDFASAAYRLGGGSARREAYAVMTGYLDSTDAELRALGTLAIAGSTEVDLKGKIRDVLKELAAVPNERGRLAAAYLEIGAEREYAETKLRDARNKLDSTKVTEEFEELLAVKKLISDEHLEGSKVETKDLLGAAIDGMLRWMDPHSAYLTPEAYAKFFQELEADYGGIGAYVNSDPEGNFKIVRPIYSGPAYEAGLQTDDMIVRIDDWPTLGHPEEDIIKRLKGKPGTPVDLYVWRRGMDPELIDRPTESMKVSLRRAQIEIPAGSDQLLPGGIGLIELTTFNKRSQEQMTEWVREMQADGMRALILDMRRNPGGLLTEAREVADLFLPANKVVVKTEGRSGEPHYERTQGPGVIAEDMPLVILTSRMTASAAEIVSGALQDHGRAVLVGRRTYGKGSVQQLVRILPEREDDWEDANGNYRWDPGERIKRDANGNGEVDYAPRVKLTIARYLLPSGRSIHRELDREGNLVSPGGVQPEHEIDMPLIERWRYEERERVRTGDVLQDYLAEHYAANRELFHRLAVNDTKNPELYPRFDGLVAALDTTLSRNDVRDVLRKEIRRRVQDDLGREFPFGDYVEDVQVQKAIQVALEALGQSVDDFTEYGLVFDLESAVRPDDLATLDPDGNRRLHRARQLLEDARSGGAVLSDESLDEILTLISDLERSEKN